MSGELVEREEAAAEERSIVLSLAGETHTLGNALRDVMWSHPHIQLASYTQEHPSSDEILLRCQTSGAISAEQGLVEALQMTQQILGHMGGTMAAAAAAWEAAHPQQQQQQPQQPRRQARPLGEAMDVDDDDSDE